MAPLACPQTHPIDAAHNFNKLVCNNIASDFDDSTSDSDNDDVEDNNFESEFENTDKSADKGEIIFSSKEAHENKQKIVLTHNKLPDDQMKLFWKNLQSSVSNVVSSVTLFVLCLESTVGTYYSVGKY